MAVAKMCYLNVYGPETALAQTLSAIAKCCLFAPEEGEAIHSALRFEQNRYAPLLTKAKGLLKDLGVSSLAGEYKGDTCAYCLDEAEQFLETFAAQVAARSKRKAEVEAELEIQTRTAALLGHMKDLDVNIEELFCVETLKVRVGRLPKTSYVRLSYYADKGFNFTEYFNFLVYDFDGEYYWGMYFAPADNAKDIDDIFASLYFERTWVPEFVRGKPSQALAEIASREGELRTELDEINALKGFATGEEIEKIQDIAAWLLLMNQLHEMKRYAMVFDNMFYISGFVPNDDYKAFEKLIAELPNVKINEAEQKEELPAKPPVKLKNGWFAKPYQMYTEMYGLPNYTNIDPTSMVSWIYSILFGIMFADIGQGLLLGLFGYFFMYKKRGLAIGHILARAAIFCCIFGFLFGSVFGLEHLMDPLWHAMGLAEKPFEVMGTGSINTILLLSIAVGVLIVSISIITSIASKLKRHQRGQAITNANGVAGLIFYLAVVFLLVDSMLLHTGIAGGPAYIAIAVALPFLVMYMGEPLTQLINGEKLHIHSIPDLFISGFFEMFVTALEFLSNTVSFLRVGGFVLAHAGIMSVVLTLAEMSSGVVYVIILIIGNLFATCLEGLLVAIQALRLNYYEVFSRFYEADGKAFEPLAIHPDTVEL